jgi:uncharacterized protein (TIGR02145 family)
MSEPRFLRFKDLQDVKACSLLCLLFSTIAFFSCADIPEELRDEASGKVYSYCVLDWQRMCLTGIFTHKDCSGKPNNSCPYGSPKGCSGNIFNSSTSFCYDGNVYQKCSGVEYNPTTHICEGYAANPAKCGGSSYNPVEQRCQSGIVETQCGTEWYKQSTQFCAREYGNYGDYYVRDKCGGNEYDPKTQFCYGNSIYDKCSGSTSYYNTPGYNPSSQFCYKNGNGDYGVYNKCGEQDYNPEAYYCKNGTTLTQYGYVTDGNGKTYKTVTIGTQTWIAENLNYDVEGSKCYENQESNCNKYGRLYNWLTAMTVCPSGWHLPSNEEWQVLVDVAGGDREVGKNLKTANGWYDYEGIGNGTDIHGSSALPGGHGYSGGYFDFAGFHGYWWSSSEFNSDYDYVYYWAMGCCNEGVLSSGIDMSNLLSVRCVRD